MCFSAPASFIASGGLAVLGGGSLIVAKKKDKILAAIPLLFAIQQAFEGIQWLHLNMGSSSLAAGYGFLVFAFIVWPIYVPTFVFVLDEKKRKIVRWFLFLGIAVAIYFIAIFLTQALSINKLRACVSYDFNFPYGNIVNFFYVVAVFGPLFLSSRAIFRWFGVAIAFFAAVSWFFFAVTFASVWCFFAAIVSSMFFVYLKFKDS